jgi:protein RecA
MANKKKEDNSENNDQPVVKKTPDKKEEKATGRRKIIQDRMKALGVGIEHLRMGKDFKPVEALSTGQIEIDGILGELAGIPKGSLVEYCGNPSSGKSTEVYMLMAEAHKQGKRCAYFDVENSLFPPRAESLGVQVYNEDLFESYGDIEYAETYCSMIEEWVKSGDYAVIAIDSISALIPQVDYDKQFKDNPKIGAHAMLMNRMTKKLLHLCAKTGTIVVMINQFRMGAGARPNEMVQRSTGGASVEYFCHMRLWFRKINGANGNVIGGNGEIIGGYSNVVVQKTRFSQPGLSTKFPIYFASAQVNPLGEFLYISAARGKDYIRVVRKAYEYLNTDTGEIVKSKDAATFVRLLIDQPAPENRIKGDNSENAFDYICGRLKYNEVQKQAVIDALDRDEEIEAPYDSKALIFADLDEIDIDPSDIDMSEGEE